MGRKPLPRRKVEEVKRLLREGHSCRKTSRMAGVSLGKVGGIRKSMEIDVEGEVLHLVGTSMYESSFRKKIYNVRGMYHFNYSIRSYVLHPMLKWTEDMVYDYIEAHGLRLNPCYEKYYHSGNCYYCPYVTSLTYYSRLAGLQPRLFSKIVEAEKAMRNKGAAIYLGQGKILHLSKFMSFLTSNPSKALTLKKCEARVLSKRLFTCQKRCLM